MQNLLYPQDRIKKKRVYLSNSDNYGLTNRMDSKANRKRGLLFLHLREKSKMDLVRSEIDAENNAALGFSNQIGGTVGNAVDEKTGRNMIIYHATKAEFQKSLSRLQKVLDHFAKNKLKG